MKKETVIIVIIVTFVAGFLAGAISGIKFYAREHGGTAHVNMPVEGSSQPVSTDEINRLEAIVRKEPKNARALVELGNLYFDSNQPQKAIDAYERSLVLEPGNPDVRTDMGIMYRAVKDYDRAIKEFREAARIDPGHRNSRFNLGVVLQNDKKDLEGAVAAWEDFLKVEPPGERAETVKAEIQQLRRLLANK
ncbi:MAG: Tetratricopeptide repeat protein [Syntrophorhabdaceae bacterium PtaU1.Bin034]|jgi:cytochrome c-type biogenesis protein CcmH/NrfG|nr:MAG: Tetratricopeptide repeat protein [Syntrophorhabdaceae bacterium PtaU1.Bin034]